jgi:hypothetical protein
MRRFQFLSLLVVGAALLAPMSSQAAGRSPAQVAVKAEVRVYDSGHKDYHVWDDHEDQTYRKYLTDNHQTYRPIAKLNNKQQNTYWNFRHTNDKNDKK